MNERMNEQKGCVIASFDTNLLFNHMISLNTSVLIRLFVHSFVRSYRG